jgi:hypothetical protein
LGETQLPQSPESSLHSKLEPLSVAAKTKLALLEVVVLGGPELIVVSGGVVSAVDCTVQLCEAGVASVLPAGSVAFTEKV